jgi:hypothetical protein
MRATPVRTERTHLWRYCSIRHKIIRYKIDRYRMMRHRANGVNNLADVPGAGARALQQVRPSRFDCRDRSCWRCPMLRRSQRIEKIGARPWRSIDCCRECCVIARAVRMEWLLDVEICAASPLGLRESSPAGFVRSAPRPSKKSVFRCDRLPQTKRKSC